MVSEASRFVCKFSIPLYYNFSSQELYRSIIAIFNVKDMIGRDHPTFTNMIRNIFGDAHLEKSSSLYNNFSYNFFDQFFIQLYIWICRTTAEQRMAMINTLVISVMLFEVQFRTAHCPMVQFMKLKIRPYFLTGKIRA